MAWGKKKTTFELTLEIIGRYGPSIVASWALIKATSAEITARKAKEEAERAYNFVNNHEH